MALFTPELSVYFTLEQGTPIRHDVGVRGEEVDLYLGSELQLYSSPEGLRRLAEKATEACDAALAKAQQEAEQS